MELTIPAIKRTVGLLMRANCEDFATVQETAREMKVTKTALMAFIDDNHKHFKTAQRIVQKVKGGRILSEKNLGRVIQGVYDRPDLNPFESEYLERIKAEWKRAIYVQEYEEYGEHLCWYLPEDKQRKDSYGKPVTDDDNRNNTFLWRNTPEKLQEIRDAGHAREDYVWGGGDGRSRIRFKYMVSANDIAALRADGWTIFGGPEVGHTPKAE